MATTPQTSLEPPAPTKKKQTLKEVFTGLPGWAWLFVLGCLAIPAVSLGGGIPTLLGFSGAAFCASASKKQEWSVAGRILACAGITAAAWGFFISIVMSFAK